MRHILSRVAVKVKMDGSQRLVSRCDRRVSDEHGDSHSARVSVSNVIFIDGGIFHSGLEVANEIEHLNLTP